MNDARLKFKLRSVIAVMLTLMFVFNINAQKVSVSGTVKDATGEPVIGASVVEKGTTNGLTTNFNGEFTLSVSPNATLAISYIGYKTQEVAVGSQRSLNITLQEDAKVLGEVVAIGYGTVKKNDATGSVTAIKPEEMNKGLTTNPQDMITGKIAGVVVTPSGGAPGSGSTIRIRGGSSLNASNDPLIVIDGLTIDNNGIQGVSNFLSTINPNDIESFSVLKDASATAIYGSRASNGVIIITTKKGKEGTKPKVTYSGNFNVSTIGDYIDVMNGDEYRAYANKLYAGKADILSKLGTANTNWQSLIYQTALGHDHNVNLTGGFKKMPYRLSFGYTNQDGILKTSNFERYTGAINLSPSLLDDHLKININAKGMLVKNRFGNTDAISAAVRMDPTQPVYADGNIYKTQFEDYFQWYIFDNNNNFKSVNGDAPHNPVALLNQKDDRSKANSLIGNIDFDYKFHFLPELRAHLNLATDISHGRQDTWISQYSATNSLALNGGYQGYTIQDKWNRLLNAYLQYGKEFTSQKFDLMGGYEWQRFHREGSWDGKPLVANAEGKMHEYQADVINWATHNQLVSFFGRANYSLLDRYLFTATMRADGSSRFAPGNKWAYFPSFAFAWKISNEPFLTNSRNLSDLKLRLGYGKTGQQDGLPDFVYLPVYTLNIDGAYYPFGDKYFPTARPDAYNTNLKWETTTTYNVGIDLSLYNNRFTAALDVYYRITDDLLNVTPIPAGTNFKNKVMQNVGSLNNRGVELMLNWKPISTRDVTWDLGYNITYNRNKITKLTTGEVADYYVPTGGIFQGNVQAHAVGYPANSFFVYQQVYDNNGKPIEGLYVDRNGDHQITDKDKYFFHNASPDFTMGFTSKLIYKSFDFGVSLRSSIGNYVYNSVAAERANIGTNGIWTPLGFFQNVTTSAFETNFKGVSSDAYLSDYYVQDGSFIRVDNITAGYSFKKMFGIIQSGRLSATVQNPFLFTKYKGLDPEVFGGIDGSIYPKPIITVLGLTLNF